MMRISFESPALIAVRNWLAGSQPTQRGRSGGRMASRLTFRAEQLEPRTMLDAGMRAFLPDLVAKSDTGASSVDNRTFDRTPELTGSVQGSASQVRLRIDGVRVAVLPVVNGKWTYTVRAEKALEAGTHTIAVRPLDASGKAGKLSKPLDVEIVTQSPTASTIRLAGSSDTGLKGDGTTIVSKPTIRGIAQPGRLVKVAIDGVPAGQVQSDANTGKWSFKAPRLANGPHDVTATVENRAGLQSAATSFAVTVNGQRTVMLDASSGQPVELTASHILGRQTQGFTVTKVHGGTLEKWSPAKNAWKKIPAKAFSTDPAKLQNAPAIRTISFDDLVRWTPSGNAQGIGAAFDVIPLDEAGRAIAPAPQAGTVPGKVVDGVIGDYTQSLGATISWKDPVDGGGGQSTRYSIEVTREDGKTMLYNVPSNVHEVSSVEGGAVSSARIWGATKTGAGEIEPAASDDVAYYVTNTSYQPMQVSNYTVNQATLSPAPGTVITTGQSAPFEVAPGKSVTVTINPVGVSHDGVLNTIGVGYLPLGIAAHPDGSRVYVANQNSNTVSVINTTTNSVQATVGLGGGFSPFGLAVSPDGGHVYTADYASNAVTVINTATDTSSAVVGVGKYPKGVAVSPDSRHVYVTNNGSNSVSVIDAASNTVTATIGVGSLPLGVAASPDGARVYVANQGSGSMSVIDAGTNQVTGSINTSATWVAVSPDSKVVYATSGNVVNVIDATTNQVTDTISIPIPPGATGTQLGSLAVSRDGSRLFVPNIYGNSVAQIDTATKQIISTAPVGIFPDYVAVSPDGTRVYVSNGSGNSVSLIGVVAPGTIGDGGVAQYTLTIDSSGQVSCSAKGSNQCVVSGTSVYLEDAPGTIYYVPAEDAQGQSNVLQNLVYSDTSNATFYTKSAPTVGYTNPLIPNGYSPYYNGTSATSKNTYYISSTTSQTSNVEYNVSVALQQQAKMAALTLMAEEAAQYTWGTSTTNSLTYTQSTTQTVRPGEVLYLYVENAVYRFYGDWNVLYGNTTYVLQNVWYDTPYSYSGYPSYLAAYTCDVGSDKCDQLAAGDISGLDNPFPKTLPMYPVAESNKDNNYNNSPANAVTTSA